MIVLNQISVRSKIKFAFMVSDDIKMPVADTSDTFILENGGSSIKAGFSSQSTPRHQTESHQLKFNP